MVVEDNPGPKRLINGWFYSQEIITSLCLIGFSWLADCIAPVDGQPLAKTNYVIFLVYSGICFSKITRIFNVVLNELPQIKAVFSVLSNLRPFLRDLFGMVICIFLIFGQMGINNYGGLVNSNTPNLFKSVTGSYLPKDYHKVNFNDFPNSVVSLYGIFLKNRWLDITNIYFASDQANKKNFRFFFISFQLVLNLLIFNLVIGFIVEVILSHLNKKYGKYIKIDTAILNANQGDDEDDDESSIEEEMDEDVFVDDQKDKDLEAQAALLADKLQKGIDKNLRVVTGEKKKVDRKTEIQAEMTPIL